MVRPRVLLQLDLGREIWCVRALITEIMLGGIEDMLLSGKFRAEISMAADTQCQ